MTRAAVSSAERVSHWLHKIDLKVVWGCNATQGRVYFIVLQFIRVSIHKKGPSGIYLTVFARVNIHNIFSVSGQPWPPCAEPLFSCFQTLNCAVIMHLFPPLTKTKSCPLCIVFQIPEFDNLYLDMNGIIHQCSHPNDEDVHFRISEEKIFADIFHYLEVLFRIIKPRKVFFMAVDGVAPRAKMNQQRGRRFR